MHCVQFGSYQRITICRTFSYCVFIVNCRKYKKSYCNLELDFAFVSGFFKSGALRYIYSVFLIRIHIMKYLLYSNPDPGGKKNPEIYPAPVVYIVWAGYTNIKHVGVVFKFIEFCPYICERSIGILSNIFVCLRFYSLDPDPDPNGAWLWPKHCIYCSCRLWATYIVYSIQ